MTRAARNAEQPQPSARAAVTSSVTSRNDTGQPARCLHCGYCTDACKARAYRARQLTAWARPPEEVTLPATAAARYARATEIHRQISELVTTLADIASGQQALFESTTTSKPVRTTIKELNKLTSELAALAAAASPR